MQNFFTKAFTGIKKNDLSTKSQVKTRNFFKFSLFYPKFNYFFVETKKSVKFGEFWIVQACEDASVKNHPVEAGEPFQNWINSMWLQ